MATYSQEVTQQFNALPNQYAPLLASVPYLHMVPEDMVEGKVSAGEIYLFAIGNVVCCTINIVPTDGVWSYMDVLAYIPEGYRPTNDLVFPIQTYPYRALYGKIADDTGALINFTAVDDAGFCSATVTWLRNVEGGATA